MKQRNTKSKNSSGLLVKYKSWIVWGPILVFTVWYLIIRPQLRISELMDKGKQTIAYVYDVRNIGSKGTIRAFYRFEVNGSVHEGFYDNDTLVKFDSIPVIYLPNNPERNQAKQSIVN